MRKRAKFALITLAVLIVEFAVSTIAGFQLEANNLKPSDWFNTLLYLIYFALLTMLLAGCLSCIHLLKRKRTKFTLVSLSILGYLALVFIYVGEWLDEYGLTCRLWVGMLALVPWVSLIFMIIGGSIACLQFLSIHKPVAGAIRILGTMAAVGLVLLMAYGSLVAAVLVVMPLHEHTAEVNGETMVIEVYQHIGFDVDAYYYEYKNAFVKGRLIKSEIYYDAFCPVENGFKRTPNKITYYDKDGNVTKEEAPAQH